MSPVPRRGRPLRSEVEGFREGVAHALAARRRSGDPEPALEEALRGADEHLRAGRVAEAERALSAIDVAMRTLAPEPVLTDRPRGLVSYVPTGPPESPTPDEEDRDLNRILLGQRLAVLAASRGDPVDPALDRLREASEAFRRGDRRAARAAADDAIARLESGRRDRPQPARTEPPRRDP